MSAPPTFATAAGSGPPVTEATFAEAEKLAQVTMTAAQRRQAVGSWRQAMAPYLERRTGPRTLALETSHAPALLWNPALPGVVAGPSVDRFVRSRGGKVTGAYTPQSALGTLKRICRGGGGLRFA